jgi:AcrR family transcriptional regulator
MKRNKDDWCKKILDAAEIEFTLRGMSISPELIAKCSGTDDVTFYQNFQNKQALLDALLDRFLERMEAAAFRDRDDFSAFKFIEKIAHNCVSSPVLSAYYHSVLCDTKAVNLARERFTLIAEKCLSFGAQKDMLRPDLVAEDFPLIFSMLMTILYGRSLKERNFLMERVLSLLYSGLLSNRCV